MKKKLIATLVAGAVLSTGLIGLTACGNKTVKLPTGDSVANEEKWIEAFERTDELENFTYEASATTNIEYEGTVNMNAGGEKAKNVSVNYTSKSSSYMLALFDLANDKGYTESTSSGEYKGALASKEINGKSSYTDKTYYELSQKKDEEKHKPQMYWNAEYSKSESKGSEGKDSSESKWDADETPYIYNPLSVFSHLMFSKKDINSIDKTKLEEVADATPQTIDMLYDAFTYADGVYTANLYYNTPIVEGGVIDGNYPDINGVVKCEVKVSISDGTVVGVSYKADKVSDTLYLKDYYDFKYTYSVEAVCAIKDIKSTDVSKKVTKDITKAIDAAKKLKEETTVED